MLRRDVISGTSASGDAYALFLKHGQIQFVRVVFLALFCLKTMGYGAETYEMLERNL